jgi:hypothetical protein
MEKKCPKPQALGKSCPSYPGLTVPSDKIRSPVSNFVNRFVVIQSMNTQIVLTFRG